MLIKSLASLRISLKAHCDYILVWVVHVFLVPCCEAFQRDDIYCCYLLLCCLTSSSNCSCWSGEARGQCPHAWSGPDTELPRWTSSGTTHLPVPLLLPVSLAPPMTTPTTEPRDQVVVRDCRTCTA